MRTIWKFEVPLGVNDFFSVHMPKGAVVLDVQHQNRSDKPQIWAVVETDAKPEERQFKLCGTGRPLPDERIKYVGTFQNGRYVAHLFEVIK